MKLYLLHYYHIKLYIFYLQSIQNIRFIYVLYIFHIIYLNNYLRKLVLNTIEPK